MDIAPIHRFDYLNNAGYKSIYVELGPAMKYYESDPLQSCINFRDVLAVTVSEIELLVNFRTKGTTLGPKLSSILKFLKDRGLISKSIGNEFQLVKHLSDKYHHKINYPNLNPYKDRKTFFYGFVAIFDWLVSLKERFEEFKRARAEEKARLKQEKQLRKQEAIERAEAEKKAEEERKKAEKAEQKRQERNAKAREKRKLDRIAREEAARVKKEEEKKAQKEANKQLKKIRWQERVEKLKKILPWVGYGALTVVGGIGLGLTVAAIRESTKKDDYSFHPLEDLPDMNTKVNQ